MPSHHRDPPLKQGVGIGKSSCTDGLKERTTSAASASHPSIDASNVSFRVVKAVNSTTPRKYKHCQTRRFSTIHLHYRRPHDRNRSKHSAAPAEPGRKPVVGI